VRPPSVEDGAAIVPGPLKRHRERRLLRARRREREDRLLELGALVFELHRQGQRNPELLQAQAAALDEVDREVRLLEGTIDPAAAEEPGTGEWTGEWEQPEEGWAETGEWQEQTGEWEPAPEEQTAWEQTEEWQAAEEGLPEDQPAEEQPT
jgi:hypothetical protein